MSPSLIILLLDRQVGEFGGHYPTGTGPWDNRVSREVGNASMEPKEILVKRQKPIYDECRSPEDG